MATPYSLSGILNQPVGTSTTEVVEFDGLKVQVAITNLDEFVELTVEGQTTLNELCARCDTEVELPLSFASTVKVQDSATDSEIEDGVVVSDRHGQVDLSQIVSEAIELARPSLVYCKKHQTAIPKPFIIE